MRGFILLLIAWFVLMTHASADANPTTTTTYKGNQTCYTTCWDYGYGNVVCNETCY